MTLQTSNRQLPSPIVWIVSSRRNLKTYSAISTVQELSESEHLPKLAALEKKTSKSNLKSESEPEELLGHSYKRPWGSYPSLYCMLPYIIKIDPFPVQ